jgi:YD repeat-containing protein
MIAGSIGRGGRVLRAVATALLLGVSLASLASENDVIGSSGSGDLQVPHRSKFLPEPLVPFGERTPQDDAQLQAALAEYESTGRQERVEPLTAFLDANPQSPWRQSLWHNVGLVSYSNGFFTRAIDAWRNAWEAAKTATAFDHRAIADAAFGELVRMHARLGHADRVEALLAEIVDRPTIGSASEAVQGAREGLWLMREDPGIAYLCGPIALRSVLALQPARTEQEDTLRSERSSERGLTLAQVGDLAKRADMDFIPAFRDTGTDIPIPSIVHWRLNHYAAIVGRQGNRYQVKDPTFGEDLWLTAAAINEEASGFFLVSEDRLGSGWRAARPIELATTYGMGTTTTIDNKATRPYDKKDCCGSSGGKGMPSYAVHSMIVSLNLQDTPLGYAPPVGPAVQFQLTYNQRDAYQPTTFTYSNVGVKWTHNWLSFVADNPGAPGDSVWLYVAGGGRESYSGYDSATGKFTPEATLGAQLIRISDTPIAYERRFPDGSVHVYGFSDGSLVSPRRIHLTEVRDPAGNAVILNYDSQQRLISLEDAIGQLTTLSYGDAAKPLRITRVTDPYGRFAVLEYDTSGRLWRITDVIGMMSSLAYNAADFVNALTTPYGTTTFAFSGTTLGAPRSLTATDPLGRAERVETRHSTTGMTSTETPVPIVPGVTITNNWLTHRNTFYWDKDTWEAAPNVYTRAKISHWLHDKEASSKTAPVLESTKQPGERRVWMTYPGQSGTNASVYTGTLHSPSTISRVLDNGTTQLHRYEYNTFSRVIRSIDPVGREHRYDYAANGIDLIRIRRKNGAVFDTLAEYTYNAQHLPLTATDDAGQTTTYTYNSFGQVETITNSLNQTTTYVYDIDGYLQEVRNPNNQVQVSYTYDAFGRIRTQTDSQGYALTYDYDDLDRLTRTTYPDASYDELTYNKLDVVASRDRLGRVTTMTYNAIRQLEETIEPLPRTVRREWTRAGRPKALYDGEDRPIRWEYIDGRLTAEVYADTTRKTFGHDVSGRLKTVTDPLGQVKTITYTIDDRVAGLTYSNAVNATPVRHLRL